MLRDIDAAILAVKDIDVAKDFYRRVLGLEPAGGDQEGMMHYKSGTTSGARLSPSTQERIRRTPWPGPWARTSTRSWRTSGPHRASPSSTTISPGLRLQGDVHVADNFKAVWFKDPDGNILHINA